MNELDATKSLLAGWEMTVGAQEVDVLLQELLHQMHALIPIDAMAVYYLDSRSKCLALIGACSEQTQQLNLDKSVACSDAKWLALDTWSRTGSRLTQIGPKRAGKLSVLTPNTFRSDVVAIPLRPNRHQPCDPSTPTGAVVFEIGINRALRPEHLDFLDQWASPLWLALDMSVRQIWPDNANLEAVADSAGTKANRIDEAREAIVGSDTGLRAVMERVQIVAPSDMPVLILGETGTGKEVVARAIHARSPRHSKPFVRVYCGASPPELIDSQLFGHERGSFTGASDQRKGWFERADGGTLFWDEIGELPLAAQVRLLRVLQDHQIERVGGQENIHVDVRIVAATHRDLSAMVHQRTFREDLWYRVNMFPILLPGLRERVEDIPSLARHFARRAANRFGLPFVEPLPSDIKQLMDYRWPGNIRELQAVIDRAVILGGGAHLDVAKSLGNAFQQPAVSAVSVPNEPTFYEVIPESFVVAATPPTTVPSFEEAGPVDSLDSAIVRHIERALAATNGQVEGSRGAAKLLGVNPHTLRAKMRKLKIDWDRFRRF
jgi:transcriptional regulator with GAF, ATPase, and Fis domain